MIMVKRRPETFDFHLTNIEFKNFHLTTNDKVMTQNWTIVEILHALNKLLRTHFL